MRLGGLPPGTVSGFGTGAPQGQRQGWSGSEHTDALALDSVQHATYNTQRAVRNMQHTTRSMAHATRRSASCREHDDVHAHARHDPRRVHSQVLGVVVTTSSATRRKREPVLGACGSARGMRLSGCLWCRVPQGFSGRAARHRCARAHAQRPAGAPSAGLTPRGGVCVSCGGAPAPVPASSTRGLVGARARAQALLQVVRSDGPSTVRIAVVVQNAKVKAARLPLSAAPTLPHSAAVAATVSTTVVEY